MLYNNSFYLEDIHNTTQLKLPWEKLAQKTILISGATGLVGSFLVDVLLEKGIECTVFALTRNLERAEQRFSKYLSDGHLVLVHSDVNQPLHELGIKEMDYVLHLASNTHPLQYSTDPIGTITTNIIGLNHMLEYATSHHVKRFLFASSNEIYGENRGDVELFDERYCGYIDSNTMRAGYPESKRCGEALCQAYKVQKSLDVVIARLTRTYGPTMQMSDSKAISQFIKKGIAGDNIVLKSEGKQYYSYQYVADSVAGLLYILLCGENGEAYNIADCGSDIMLKDLAAMIARINNKEVVFELPDNIEAAGYSTATKARLNGQKLRRLGWEPKYDINEGITRTIAILKGQTHI